MLMKNAKPENTQRLINVVGGTLLTLVGCYALRVTDGGIEGEVMDLSIPRRIEHPIPVEFLTEQYDRPSEPRVLTFEDGVIPTQEASLPDPYQTNFNARVEHFYNLFTGERSRDINTRIERTRQYSDLIQATAERHNIHPETLYAIVVNESGGDSQAINNEGDAGLAQISDITAAELIRLGHPCQDRLDPEQNLEAAAFYLRHLMDKEVLSVDSNLAIAAYTIGTTGVLNAMNRTGGTNYAETFPGSYVPKIRSVERIVVEREMF
tara:strand:- start:2816 stop:3610 length:795 start_codon:yes stop_codon:yes gene_type:complete